MWRTCCTALPPRKSSRPCFDRASIGKQRTLRVLGSSKAEAGNRPLRQAALKRGDRASRRRGRERRIAPRAVHTLSSLHRVNIQVLSISVACSIHNQYRLCTNSVQLQVYNDVPRNDALELESRRVTLTRVVCCDDCWRLYRYCPVVCVPAPPGVFLPV